MLLVGKITVVKVVGMNAETTRYGVIAFSIVPVMVPLPEGDAFFFVYKLIERSVVFPGLQFVADIQAVSFAEEIYSSASLVYS